MSPVPPQFLKNMKKKKGSAETPQQDAKAQAIMAKLHLKPKGK